MVEWVCKKMDIYPFFFDIIVLGILKNKKNIIISFVVVILFTIGYVLISNCLLFGINKQYEVYEDLSEYKITLSDKYYVTGFISSKQGSAEIIEKDGEYVLKLTGVKNTTYKFGISGEDDEQLRFEYHFDDDGKLVLKKIKVFN